MSTSSPIHAAIQHGRPAAILVSDDRRAIEVQRRIPRAHRETVKVYTLSERRLAAGRVLVLDGSIIDLAEIEPDLVRSLRDQAVQSARPGPDPMPFALVCALALVGLVTWLAYLVFGGVL